MGAAEGLKTCVLHNVVCDLQVKPHPALLPRSAGLAAHGSAAAAARARRPEALPGHGPRRRGQRAQPSHLGAHGAEREVHVGGDAEAPQTEAQGALRELGVASQGAQHVGRVRGDRVAGGAGGHRQPREARHQALPLHTLERHVENARQARGAGPVQMRAAEGLESGPQPLAQRREPHAFRGQLASGQLAGEAKAHDLVSGQRPGPQRALLSPTVHQRLQQPPGALAHVERTDAFGAVDLVRRDRDEVERERVHIERHLARGLGAIAVQGDTALAAQCADRGEVLQHTDLVVRVHDRGQHGVGTQRRRERRRLDQPGAVGREIGDAEAFLLEALAGIEHGLVLGARGEHVTAAVRVGARDPEDRQVVGFGGPGGEHDLIDRRPQEGGDLGARLRDARGGDRTQGMRRGGIAEVPARRETAAHGRRHGRVDRSRGRVVEVQRPRGAHGGSAPAWRRRLCTAVRKPRRMLTSF